MDSVLVPIAAWNQSWVVHCKHAGMGEKVLDYLGRYLFLVAVTNSRLETVDDDGTVRFRYRDNRSGELETATVSAEEFIHRFLAHVLPEGFTMIRYSGLFSSSNRDRLDAARRLLAAAAAPPCAEGSLGAATDGTPAESAQIPRPDPARCPSCNLGRLVVIEMIPRPRRTRGRPP